MTVISSFSKRPLKMDAASIKRREDYQNLPKAEKEALRAKRREAYKKDPERFRVYVQKWQEKHPTYGANFMREHHKIHKEHTRNKNRTPEMANAHSKIEYHKKHGLELAELCELCPDEDKRPAVETHHPDYNYPMVVLSLCKSYHTCLHHWLKKQPMEAIMF